MVLENGETVRVNGKRGTFTVVESISNGKGEEGYRLISNKTLMQHAYREDDIKPQKKKKKGRK